MFILFGGYWYVQQGTESTDVMEEKIGEGLEQDLAPIVAASIVGKWQSVDDEKFIREFKADGTALDTYEGEADVSATWKAFSTKSPVEVAFPIEADTAYVQMTVNTEEAQTLNFQVVKVTPEDLELIYMDRGGILVFKKVQ